MPINMPALLGTRGFAGFVRPLSVVAKTTGGSGTKQWQEDGALTSIGKAMFQPAPMQPTAITPEGAGDKDDWLVTTENKSAVLEEGYTLQDSEGDKFVINKVMPYDTFYELLVREV